jgi:hypothetical protein
MTTSGSLIYILLQKKLKKYKITKIDTIENFSDSLIMTIEYYKTEGKEGSDYSESYNCEHYKTIAQDSNLAEKAIKNFKNKMLRTELSESEIRAPCSFRDY